ncbi:hypothetical protein KR018_003280, partial [Drosophila ironensis]
AMALIPLPLLIVLGLFGSVEAANVVFLIGTATYNNPTWSDPLVNGILEKGHRVIMLSTGPRLANISKDLDYEYFGLKTSYDEMDRFTRKFENHASEYKRSGTLLQLVLWYNMQSETCRQILGLKHSRKQSRKIEKYLKRDIDLIITDVTPGMDCLINLVPSWRLKPILGISGGKLTTDLIDLLQADNTINPAKIPHFINPVPQQMTFMQRLHNHLMCSGSRLIKYIILRRGLRDTVLLENVYPNPQLVLLNTHPALDYVQNMPPQVVQVAGLHIHPKRNPLPVLLNEFTNQFPNGIIYIDLPHIELMYKVGLASVSKMIENHTTYGFIWNMGNIKNRPKPINNLFRFTVDKRMQQDLLAAGGVIACINHGDSFSIIEAVNFGIPMVLLPLRFEEFNNAQRVGERKMGVVLATSGFTSASMTNALSDVLDDATIISNAYQAQQKLRASPQTPLDLAIWHVEQMIADRHMYRYLAQPEARAQNFFVANSLDVLTVPILLFVFFVAIIIRLV